MAGGLRVTVLQTKRRFCKVVIGTLQTKFSGPMPTNSIIITEASPVGLALALGTCLRTCAAIVTAAEWPTPTRVTFASRALIGQCTSTMPRTNKTVTINRACRFTSGFRQKHGIFVRILQTFASAKIVANTVAIALGT